MEVMMIHFNDKRRRQRRREMKLFLVSMNDILISQLPLICGPIVSGRFQFRHAVCLLSLLRLLSLLCVCARLPSTGTSLHGATSFFHPSSPFHHVGWKHFTFISRTVWILRFLMCTANHQKCFTLWWLYGLVSSTQSFVVVSRASWQ